MSQTARPQLWSVACSDLELKGTRSILQTGGLKCLLAWSQFSLVYTELPVYKITSDALLLPVEYSCQAPAWGVIWNAFNASLKENGWPEYSCSFSVQLICNTSFSVRTYSLQCVIFCSNSEHILTTRLSPQELADKAVSQYSLYLFLLHSSFQSVKWRTHILFILLLDVCQAAIGSMNQTNSQYIGVVHYFKGKTVHWAR